MLSFMGEDLFSGFGFGLGVPLQLFDEQYARCHEHACHTAGVTIKKGVASS
jgi:hypothetical protein